MSEGLDAIKRVIAAFDRSDWAEIDVRSGGVRVHLATRAPGGSPATSPAPPAPSEAARPAVMIDVAGTAPSAPGPPADAHVVVSPSPGILWRAPEPGAAPFTDLGDTVDASATVCIVEVMKLMNHVKAGVGGEVVAVYGENGVAVRKGEPLFAIAPSRSS